MGDSTRYNGARGGPVGGPGRLHPWRLSSTQGWIGERTQPLIWTLWVLPDRADDSKRLRASPNPFWFVSAVQKQVGQAVGTQQDENL